VSQEVDYVLVDEYPAERLFSLKRGHEERRGSEREWCSPQHVEACVRKLAVSLGIHVVGETEESDSKSDSAPGPSGPPKRIRVYELARELGLTNKEALDLCLQLGIPVKSHSSSVRDTQADRVRRLHADLADVAPDAGPHTDVAASGPHAAGGPLDADEARLGPTTGVVKWFDDEKGYGFVSPASGRDVFVHYTGIVGPGRRTLTQGQRVRMNVVPGDKGLEAQEVVVTANDDPSEAMTQMR
jgi:cold shock protein